MNGSATSSQAGDSQTLESKLLMHRVTRQDTNTLNGNPLAFLMSDVKSVVDSMDAHSQSSPGAPVIVSKDLKSVHGDTVKIDMLHDLMGLPVMGERNVEGKEEGISRSQFGLRVDLTRKPVYAGSTMAQQRRGYPLRRAARMALEEYWKRIYGEIMWYHIMGARGTYEADDIIMPPTEPTFIDGVAQSLESEVYVNPLLTPTYDRHFFAGAAESIDGTGGTNALSPTDTMDLATIKRISVEMQTMSHPLGAIDLSEVDKPQNTDPFHLMLVTPQQYADIENSSPDFATLQSNALKRTSGFNHPLFKNDCFMTDNILVKKYFKPVRWKSGDTVSISNDDAAPTTAEQTVPGNVPHVDRAVILGRQALALALAGDTNGAVFKTHEEKFDSDDKDRMTLKWMGGMKKVRQTTRSGKAYDVGTIIVDSTVTTAT